jgi:hypothetical protein
MEKSSLIISPLALLLSDYDFDKYFFLIIDIFHLYTLALYFELDLLKLDSIGVADRFIGEFSTQF